MSAPIRIPWLLEIWVVAAAEGGGEEREIVTVSLSVFAKSNEIMMILFAFLASDELLIFNRFYGLFLFVYPP